MSRIAVVIKADTRALQRAVALARHDARRGRAWRLLPRPAQRAVVAFELQVARVREIVAG